MRWLLIMSLTPLLTLGIIADLHNRKDIPRLHWSDVVPFGDKQWREFARAEANLTDAVSDFNAESVDACVLLGDEVDGHGAAYAGDTAQRITDTNLRLNENLVITNTFNGPVIRVIGNHERPIWAGIDGREQLEDYWAVVDAVGNSNDVTRDNEFVETNSPITHGAGNNVQSYTCEIGPVRIVNLKTNVGTGNIDSDWDMTTEQLAWIPTALDTPKPVVVVTHTLLAANSNGWGYATQDHAEDVRAAFEAAGNVVACFSGHFHRNTISGFNSPLVSVVNGIRYVALRAPVLGPDDGDTELGATLADSSHYIVKFYSLSVGSNQANFEIVGYNSGIGRVADTYGLF